VIWLISTANPTVVNTSFNSWGDGARNLQRQFFDPPDLNGGTGKYG
jgi:hypothetical protein